MELILGFFLYLYLTPPEESLVWFFNFYFLWLPLLLTKLRPDVTEAFPQPLLPLLCWAVSFLYVCASWQQQHYYIHMDFGLLTGLYLYYFFLEYCIENYPA